MPTVRSAPSTGASDPSHVCLVSSLYPPDVLGGAEKSVHAVARGLTDRGYTVSVLTTQSTSEGTRQFTRERSEGVDVYRIAPLNLYAPIEYREQPSWKKPFHHAIDLWNPHTYYHVKRAVRVIDPDVVHTHNFGGFSASVFPAVGQYPLVHTLHDYRLLHVNNALFGDGSITEPGSLMRPFQALHRRSLEPYLDHVVAPSSFIVEKHREYGFFNGIPSTRLRYGIEMGGVSPEEKPFDDTFRVIYAGQLTEQKGVDLLVDAFNRFDHDDARLDVLGKGPARADLETMAHRDDRITFHGFVTGETLDGFYRRADVTVVPSRWYDNSPMVIYESYAQSTPVVGADIGGIPELIEDGETGVVFDPGDVDALHDALRRAASLPERSYRAAHRRSEKYSLKNHLDGLLSVYRNCSPE